jgi:hypothetical protein
MFAGPSTAPVTSWWYIVAQCDMDNDTSVNSCYFTASYDVKTQAMNEGR